jgi:hypothetical protein
MPFISTLPGVSCEIYFQMLTPSMVAMNEEKVKEIAACTQQQAD